MAEYLSNSDCLAQTFRIVSRGAGRQQISVG